LAGGVNVNVSMAFVGGITHSEKSEGKGREKKERERKGISKSHPKA
jgi:hypothetical protein